jgi:molecular chaperone GrpE
MNSKGAEAARSPKGRNCTSEAGDTEDRGDMENREEDRTELVADEATAAEAGGEGEAAAGVALVGDDELEGLRKELEEARAQASEYLEGWQRTKAEFVNYRKRQEADWKQRTRLSNAALIANILPVLDDLERALLTLPQSLRNLTWVEGVFLIKRRLDTILESEGLKPIETAGQTFDPLYHEAVAYEETQGYEDGEIIDEVQRGYILGDRVIRPALVRVARAPEMPAEADECEEVGQSE